MVLPAHLDHLVSQDNLVHQDHLEFKDHQDQRDPWALLGLQDPMDKQDQMVLQV